MDCKNSNVKTLVCHCKEQSDEAIFRNNFSFFFSLINLTSVATAQSEDQINEEECSFNGIRLSGKIQFVEYFPDLKVKIVDSFANECGEWQIVDSFPDVKIQIVETFADIKIKFVESFPGIP